MSTNFSVPDPTPQLIKVAESAKAASILLGQSTNEQRCEALTEMANALNNNACLLYTSPSPRDATLSRMPSSA